ncbi:MAG: dihydrolipoyl dehydrogenase family protein, partial [Acidimicrobiales bacterium]
MDLAIIGAGSAAFAAAIKASELRARVVLVERGTVGGTCTNAGCVPSKALLAAADTHHTSRHHAFAGIPHLDGTSPDLAALVAQKDAMVADRRQAKYLDLIDEYGFGLRPGTARFIDAQTLDVDGEQLRADRYLIATGASPALPPIDGLADVDYLTSTTALELTDLPRRLAVLGAGSVGLELGQAFARLGAKVTFLDIAERIAPDEEPEVSAALADILTEDGMRIATGATIKQVSQAADGSVTLAGDLGELGDTLQIDRLMVATGRAPNTADLNLAAAGVEVDPGGFVTVDESLRTSNPRVWAAGDVTASPQYVYVAAAQGTLAADNALTGAGRRIDNRAVPRVTFTSPAIAAVGFTEAQA